MFHLVLSACLASNPAACADMVLPAGDSVDQVACLDLATATAESWIEQHPGLTSGATACVETDDLPALDVREIAPGVFFHQGIIDQIAPDNAGRIANLSFIVGDTVAVIDAGGSRAEGQELYAAIRQVTDKPISHLILTHMHPDHTFGAEVFAEAGATIIGHPNLERSLQTRAETYLANFDRIVGPDVMIGTRVILPDESAASGQQIDLGGTVLTLFPVETAHTDNDMMVRDSASGTLFTGDLIFRDLLPVVDGSLTGWLDWMTTAPEPVAARIVPGHGPMAGTWAEATGPQKTYLTALRNVTRIAIDSGTPMSQAVPEITQMLQEFAKDWVAFDETAPRDATTAYKELEWD